MLIWIWATFLKWCFNNSKILVYGAIALAISGLVIKAYYVVQENATNKIVISNLKAVNQENVKTIENLIIDSRIKEQIILDRDQKIGQLQLVTDQIVVDLGITDRDLAAESIRTYLKNLKAITND